ncbi:MAG: T9SS type A sorting domain-containing protein, partial [Bacteroidota bacterium]
QLRVVFDADTVLVNSGVPAPVEIKGKVLLGSPTRPALGVYGLAFAMHYPEFVGHNPEADYKSDYFGSPNHILWLSRDNHSRSQLDLGVTRKNGLNANGYGAIAEITFRADFIIIIDVAGRSSDRVIPFTVPVDGIKAIDNKGNPKDITVPVQQDTLWIKLTGTTAASEAAGSDIILSPNPATTSATLLLGDVQEAQVEILDPSGRTVMSQSVAGNVVNFSLGDFPAGVYTVRVRSDEKLVTRKLTIVQHP